MDSKNAEWHYETKEKSQQINYSWQKTQNNQTLIRKKSQRGDERWEDVHIIRKISYNNNGDDSRGGKIDFRPFFQKPGSHGLICPSKTFR